MENLPDEKQVVDILGRSQVLRVDTEELTLSLEKHNKVNIQPKGTILGAKVEVNQDGSITPTLTFDTKKLREPKKNIDTKQILDDAIEDFWNEQV